ncbi:sulfurtransferase [Bacillus sp. FJAT-45037]|uniref:sulfurtransferase n=1 Tax=Bacillus sp. FJAT-45037 TaxID=2011007 RepID=UPI000C23B26A|nr:sulfurtransferase [Bacillus sp. FJAT-45037]
MRKVIIFVSLCIVASLWPVGVSAKEVVYLNHELLVQAKELARKLNESTLIIVDLREEGYQEGHIPGAIHLDVNELVDPTHPIDGYLIRPESFEQLMSQLGVGNHDEVIVYDDGRDTAATRMFYALELYGHQNVKVLNGGYKAWLAASGDEETGTIIPKETNFKVKSTLPLEVDKDYVQSAMNQPGKVLLDVRSHDEYTGKDVRAKRGGHIPSAVNLEWNKVLTDGDVPVFKSAQEIEELLQEIGVNREIETIIYCQKAMRASHMYFTLRLLGFGQLKMYEGSWEEWGNDPDTPITEMQSM